jgi:hypothetical protein
MKIGEADAVDSEFIDVRRLNDLLAVAAEFTVAEVVGHDEDDIRPVAQIGRRLSARFERIV